MTQPRQAVLVQLMALFGVAKTGAGQFVLLQAPAGLGKSHLLRQFAQSLPAQQHGFVQSSGKLLAGLLHSLHPSLSGERDADFLEAARCFAPDLNWAVVAAQPHLEREQMWAAIARAAQRLAVRLGGLVLLLEDIHARSNDDVAVLRFLYRQWLHTHAPILLLASARPNLHEVVWDGISTDALLEHATTPVRLDLSALGLSEVQRLSEDLLPDAAVPPEFVAWLYQHSQGHPLHATELLRWLLQGGALTHLGATWQFRLSDGLVVPAQLEAVLLARLEVVRHEPETWRVLSDVALSDSPKSSQALVQLGLSSHAVQRALRRLTTLGLLRLELQGGISMYAVSHPLYPPLLESLLSQREYQAAHLRALRLETSLYQQAHHARAANHPDALHLTRQAWLYANNHHAWAEVELQGLALLEMSLSQEEQSDVNYSVGDALLVQGRYQAAIDFFQRSTHPLAFKEHIYCLVRLVRDREGMALLGEDAQALTTDLLYYWTCFPMRLGMQALAQTRLETLRQAEQGKPESRIVLLYCEHWYLKIFEPHRLGRQVEIFLEAHQLHGIQPDYNVFNWLADAYVGLGLPEQAQAVMDKVLEQHRTRPNDATEANYLVSSAKIAFLRGDLLEARQQYLAALRVASASQDPIHQSYAHFGLYCTDYALGLECHAHLERLKASLAAMDFAKFDAPFDLEIAWREASLGRLSNTTAPTESPQGSDCLAAARLWLLEGKPALALQALQGWQPQTWLEAGTTQIQPRPADHALLEGLAQHFLGNPEALPTLEVALSLCQTKLQHAEVELARSLLMAAPSTTALETLRQHGAGIATFLRRLFVGALEMTQTTPEAANSEQFIRTLGVFALEQDGVLKPWKAQKARELLALLICTSLGASGFISREHILDNLWSDGDFASADGAFRVTLSRLRSSLGGAASIERDAQGRYGLVGARLDVHEFLKALSKRELEQAVAWYGGEFLPRSELGIAQMLRQKLHQQWREALLQLAIEQPEPKAMLFYEKLLEADPFDLEAVLGLGRTWRSRGGDLRLLRLLEQSKAQFLLEVGEIPTELEQMLLEVQAGRHRQGTAVVG